MPAGMTTVEQVHAWTTMVLREVNGPKSVVETSGFLPEPVAQAPTIESPSDGVRLICRVNLQIDPAYASDRTKKYFMFAKELTVGTIPTQLTTA